MIEEEIENKKLTLAKMDKEILVKLKVIDDLSAIVDNTNERIQIVERLELELHATNQRIRELEKKRASNLKFEIVSLAAQVWILIIIIYIVYSGY